MEATLELEKLGKPRSLQDLAEWSGHNPAFWAQEVREGRLRAFRLGIGIRVFQADLEEYLKRNVWTGPAPERDPRRNTDWRKGGGRRPKKGDRTRRATVAARELEA